MLKKIKCTSCGKTNILNINKKIIAEVKLREGFLYKAEKIEVIENEVDEDKCWNCGAKLVF